jgi:hypothetical protein
MRRGDGAQSGYDTPQEEKIQVIVDSFFELSTLNFYNNMKLLFIFNKKV